MVSDFYLPLLVVLVVLAAVLREDFAFTLIYLLAGAFALGRWWSNRALRAVVARRTFPSHVFFGESVPVRLELTNRGLLPVVWLNLHESLPVNLAIPNFFRRVASLGPKERAVFEYTLQAHRRGGYPIGPLSLQSGDLLGLMGPIRLECASEVLTVYPKIVPLAGVELPSRSPMGTLRHREPIFEDPSRLLGKREYAAGDSLRRIDWKATARAGRLQVKKFEPSIALEVSIFLNLNVLEYEARSRFQSGELAIVAASSLASWIAGRKQAIGLATNGAYPWSEGGKAKPLPPRKGRAHLMRVLEVLATVEMAETEALAALLSREIHRLSWGTTLILLTGQAGEDLFEALFQARRSGMNATLVLCGPVAEAGEIRRRARQFGFPSYHLLSEGDLDAWRAT